MTSKASPAHEEPQDRIDLLARYPQLNAPQVSRRTLMALGSLMALNLVGCGASHDPDSPAPIYAHNGMVSTLAGGGTTFGTADGTGTAARFHSPQGVAVDSSGNVYVADYGNHMIRKVTSAGVVTTLAGSTTHGTADGTGTAASFFNPAGVAVDSSGNVYVADFNNHMIRKVTSAGVVTTLAGQGPSHPGSADGTGAAAQFYNPMGVAVDSGGNVYVADFSYHTVRKITSAGGVTTFAGQANNSGSADGTGATASFNGPAGVAVDSSGNVYVADSYSHTIRKITPTGGVATLAGLAGSPGNTDGSGAAASFNTPDGVAVDSGGNVYVADTQNNLIRQVTSAGVVSTLAGSGVSTFADGPAHSAAFKYPYGVTVDSSGMVYVADTNNHSIRKIT